jgi:hypothetical protein
MRECPDHSNADFYRDESPKMLIICTHCHLDYGTVQFGRSELLGFWTLSNILNYTRRHNVSETGVV